MYGKQTDISQRFSCLIDTKSKNIQDNYGQSTLARYNQPNPNPLKPLKASETTLLMNNCISVPQRVQKKTFVIGVKLLEDI